MVTESLLILTMLLFVLYLRILIPEQGMPDGGYRCMEAESDK